MSKQHLRPQDSLAFSLILAILLIVMGFIPDTENNPSNLGWTIYGALIGVLLFTAFLSAVELYSTRKNNRRKRRF